MIEINGKAPAEMMMNGQIVSEIQRNGSIAYKKATTGGIYLAQDSDFEGTADGDFKYIGTETEIEIPNTIKGVPLTEHYLMFYTDNGSLIEKVVSTNTNIVNMKYLFHQTTSTTLDVSEYDVSGSRNMVYVFRESAATTIDLSTWVLNDEYINMTGMFKDCSATTGFARTQADADLFNAPITHRPAGLTFVVKP